MKLDLLGHIAPHTDAEVFDAAYCIRYCDIDMPHYDEATRLWWKSVQPGLLARLEHQEEVRNATLEINLLKHAVRAACGPVVTTSTQLWEPCEACGREPCYLSRWGNLCEACQQAFVPLPPSHEEAR